MTKRNNRVHHAGRVNGAQVEISGVDNFGLHETVKIVNWGEKVQPLAGWALGSVRNERLYFFPFNLLLQPQGAVSVKSGPHAHDNPPNELFWTDDQIWGNDYGLAVLFDDKGDEVSRFVYPNDHVLHRLGVHPRQLRREGESWQIVEMVGAPL